MFLHVPAILQGTPKRASLSTHRGMVIGLPKPLPADGPLGLFLRVLRMIRVLGRALYRQLLHKTGMMMALHRFFEGADRIIMCTSAVAISISFS